MTWFVCFRFISAFSAPQRSADNIEDRVDQSGDGYDEEEIPDGSYVKYESTTTTTTTKTTTYKVPDRSNHKVRVNRSNRQRGIPLEKISLTFFKQFLLKIFKASWGIN